MKATKPACETAIRVAGLTKSYGRVTAVGGLDFEIAAGSTTALLGGNGAGKTTTIAMLMGLVLPTSGTAEVFGCDMARARHRVLHRMAYESPYLDMPMRLTVRQNLTVFGRLYGADRLRERIMALAADLDFEALLERPYGKLSAGQKTRISLAKALINAPDLLLLDEPTASLDPDTADWVRTHLERYRETRGATIVIASHNMAEVERMADRVIMLKAGRIVDDAPPRALIRKFGRKSLEEVFLDVARAPEREAS
ncbi:MAG: ABC transporter ATP-binding protein [Flavobacteriaceae bacterium]